MDADAVTLVRLWLAPAAFATARSARGLPTVIILGGFTDSLDGRLARCRGRTRLGVGRDLDSTADLAFLTVVPLATRATDRISPLGFSVLTARHTLRIAIALFAGLARARRPAIRARPWAAAPRIGGLAVGTTCPAAWEP